jgi:ubiquinone/menaquinone biosynthesis C-methylase UbiE
MLLPLLFDCCQPLTDALMSEDTPAAQVAADRMLAEIGRVLKPAGKYLCVTLSQVNAKLQLQYIIAISRPHTGAIRDTAYKQIRLLTLLTQVLFMSTTALMHTALYQH